MESLTVIYIGIIIYLTGMLGVGIYASKKISGTEDFLVAGRRLPLWLCTAALTATFFGGGTIMGAGGAAYKKRIPGRNRRSIWSSPMFVPGWLIFHSHYETNASHHNCGFF